MKNSFFFFSLFSLLFFFSLSHSIRLESRLLRRTQAEEIFDQNFPVIAKTIQKLKESKETSDEILKGGFQIPKVIKQTKETKTQQLNQYQQFQKQSQFTNQQDQCKNVCMFRENQQICRCQYIQHPNSISLFLLNDHHNHMSEAVQAVSSALNIHPHDAIHYVEEAHDKGESLIFNGLEQQGLLIQQLLQHYGFETKIQHNDQHTSLHQLLPVIPHYKPEKSFQKPLYHDPEPIPFHPFYSQYLPQHQIEQEPEQDPDNPLHFLFSLMDPLDHENIKEHIAGVHRIHHPQLSKEDITTETECEDEDQETCRFKEIPVDSNQESKEENEENNGLASSDSSSSIGSISHEDTIHIPVTTSNNPTVIKIKVSDKLKDSFVGKQEEIKRFFMARADEVKKELDEVKDMMAKRGNQDDNLQQAEEVKKALDTVKDLVTNQENNQGEIKKELDEVKEMVSASTMKKELDQVKNMVSNQGEENTENEENIKQTLDQVKTLVSGSSSSSISSSDIDFDTDETDNGSPSGEGASPATFIETRRPRHHAKPQIVPLTSTPLNPYDQQLYHPIIQEALNEAKDVIRDNREY